MLKKVAAMIVMGHGLIHLMGFLVQFQIAEIEGLSYSNTVLSGRLTIGASGAQVLGALWLLAALVLLAAAAGMFIDAAWDRRVLLGAALFSLPVTILGWPDSQFGVLVNILILGALFFIRRVEKDAG